MSLRIWKKAMMILGLVASLLLVHWTGGAGASSRGEWELQNPLPTGFNLLGVWGSSSDDVFAVGAYGTILHYDGSSWSPMSSGTIQPLRAVWGSSGSDVFAVGSNGTILHYGGRGLMIYVPLVQKNHRP